METHTFTDHDRQRLHALLQELALRLPRTLPDSAEIYACGLLLVEIEERGYALMDDRGAAPTAASGDRGADTLATEQPEGGEAEAALRRLCAQRLKLGPTQLGKHLRVARALSAAEVTGRQIGIEGLYQIALCDPRLRGAA